MKCYQIVMQKSEREVEVDLIRNPHLVYFVDKKEVSGEIYLKFTFRINGETFYYEQDEVGAELLLHSLRQFYKKRPAPGDRVEDWEWINWEKPEFDYERRERLLMTRMTTDEATEYFGDKDEEEGIGAGDS